MGDFMMPSLGADMEAGTLIAWKVKPGDRVRHGDIIGEVETEKGDIDIEVFEDGVVEAILVRPGEKVPVGTVLATIRPDGEPLEIAGAVSKEPARAGDGRASGRPPEVRPSVPAAIRRVRASPLARRVAAEMGIDLGAVRGTGPEGAIQRADVERAAGERASLRTASEPPPSTPPEAPPSTPPGTEPIAPPEAPPAPPPGTEPIAPPEAPPSTPPGTEPIAPPEAPPPAPPGTPSPVPPEAPPSTPPEIAPPGPPEAPPSTPPDIGPSGPPEIAPAAPPEYEPPQGRMPYEGMRHAIATAMARSNREIPHYYLETHIDMSRALGWLEDENRKRSVKERLLPAVLLIKAVASALNDVPELNAYWIDDRPVPQEAVHVGFAIALRRGGLVVPALHHADLKSPDELMAALSDVIVRAREGRLRGSELTDATITVTSLGDRGVQTVYGVIYPPQVALVGFGTITEQPWAERGLLGVRPVLTATLAGDHRATDGHSGARFMEALNRYLQTPDVL